MRRDTAESIYDDLSAEPEQTGRTLLITFPVTVPHNFSEEEVRDLVSEVIAKRLDSERESVATLIAEHSEGVAKKAEVEALKDEIRKDSDELRMAFRMDAATHRQARPRSTGGMARQKYNRGIEDESPEIQNVGQHRYPGRDDNGCGCYGHGDLRHLQRRAGLCAV